MKMVSGCQASNLSVFVFAAMVALAAAPLMAQSPPPWPTPVVTPSSTPSPGPMEITPTPTPTPSPEPTDIAPTPTPAEKSPAAPAPPEESPVSADPQAAASGSEVAKKDRVTNPGDTAFTDYAPFDLDEIEAEPFDSKWKAFFAGVRGITRYNLFDGQVKFRLGASIKVDATAGSGSGAFEDAYDPIDSGLGFRLGVIYAAGRIRNFNFSVGIDLGADPGVDSAWIEGAKGGLEVWGKYLGKLRIGFVGEPFSLERQGSSYNTAFLERSLPVQSIAPGYNLGVLVHNSRSDGRLSWAGGLFSVGQNDEKSASNSLLSITGRVTYLPVYRDEGRKLIHVGLSASSRSPTGSDVRYFSRPEARYVDIVTDTGSFSAGRLTLLGVEAATVKGPLWASAEFISSRVAAADVGNPTFRGGYVQVGWFLTGESRPYQTNGGTFGRVLPVKKYGGGNPFKKRNGGAWEVAGRISHLDLDDGSIEGGTLTDISAALSWYVNSSFRVTLNYIYATPKDQGSANIFLMRFQVNPW